MASPGGDDCGGATPEADRPHQRPFLIGVSGGTASGKVRGWAARRGLRGTATRARLVSVRGGDPSPGCGAGAGRREGWGPRAGGRAGPRPEPEAPWGRRLRGPVCVPVHGV